MAALICGSSYIWNRLRRSYIEFTLNNGAAAYSQTPKELGSLSQSPIEK